MTLATDAPTLTDLTALLSAGGFEELPHDGVLPAVALVPCRRCYSHDAIARCHRCGIPVCFGCATYLDDVCPDCLHPWPFGGSR